MKNAIKRNLFPLSVFTFGFGLMGCKSSDVSLVYNFENSSMEEKEQKKYMETVSKFIDVVDACNGDISIDEFVIFVDDSAITRYQPGEICINTREIDSVNTFFKIFLATAKEDMNAGEAYGLAMKLYENSGIGTVKDRYSDDELATYFSNEENLYLLDFTLPMLESYYFDEETSEYVREASISFVEYCIEKYGIAEAYQICENTSEEGRADLVEFKNEWLETIGIEAVYEPFATLAFSCNYTKMPEEYPYVLSGIEANWYFYPGDVKKYGYKAFIDEYLIVEELMKLDFMDVREILSDYLPEDVPAVDICTMFYGEGGEAGFYRIIENHIELYYNWEKAKYALVHEYIHYLTVGVTDMILGPGAFAEGIAEETATWGCENRLRALYMSKLYDAEEMKRLHLWDEEKGRISEEGLTYSDAYSYYYGYLNGKTYFTAEYKLIERAEKVQYIAYLSYPEMSSLTHYLVEQYGRDAVYKSYYNFDSFQELIGKDFQELYEEWAKWNKEQCDNMGMQFKD